jgi:EmrB/QacA subfamily drug resistance transporter
LTALSKISHAHRRWLVLATVSLAFFMIELDTTIVNVALPSIQNDLRVSTADLQWVVNAYLLMFGGFLLLTGRIGDLAGRKRLLVTGLAVFGLGLAMNAISPSAAALIAGRALQGLGAAIVSPSVLAILTTTFTEARDRERALGVWSAVSAASVAVGLLLGGVITDALSWRWVFVINVPITVVVLAATVWLVPESRKDERERGIDAAGAVSVTAGLGVLIYALAGARVWGWGSGRTIGLLAIAAALLVAFVMIECRSKAPLVSPRIFRIRSLVAGNLGLFLTAGGVFSMFYLTSLYVQDVLKYGPAMSGAALLPLSAGIVAGAGVAQPLVRRAGVTVTAGTGLAIAAAGMLLLTRISVHGAYALDLLPGLLVLSVGLGLAMVPLTVLGTSGLPEREAGLASGLLNATYEVGGALGLAILSTVAASTVVTNDEGSSHAAHLASMTAGFRIAYLAGALMLSAAAVMVAVLLRRRDLAAIE